MLNELHADHSWRWIARYSVGVAHHSWLARVAAGKHDVKPKKISFLLVRRLYDEMQHRADLDGNRLRTTLRVNSLLGELIVSVNELLDLK